MAHNKLYRNFIILQEDEKKHTVAGEKALSGYAKIEAKSDKCKISFYAQNLKESDNYTIVLICYKKDMKQIVDLGSLKVSDMGKGESCQEYYINNIAGLDFSYEKISGAGIGKYKDNELSFLMYGFMNGEDESNDWKKCKVVKHDYKKEKEIKKEFKKIEKDHKEEYKHEDHHCDEKEEHKHEDHHCDEKEEHKHEDHHCDEKEERKHEDHHCDEKKEHKHEDHHCDEKKEHKHEAHHCDEKKEHKHEDHHCDEKKEHKHEDHHCDEKEEHKHEDHHKKEKEDHKHDEHHKEDHHCGEKEGYEHEVHLCEMKEEHKHEDHYYGDIMGHKHKEDHHCEEKESHEHEDHLCEMKEEHKHEDHYYGDIMGHKHKENPYEVIEEYKDKSYESDWLNRDDEGAKFEEYESIIDNLKAEALDPYDFDLRGSIGEFFSDIAKGFEESRDKYKDLKYCKWYKVKVNSLDDMCNISDYNKYTVAYYPMLNYYPYIRKYGYFMLGYKCDSKGNLKHLVYGVPGRKDKEEQPYLGKTGFVTWMEVEGTDVGCWLMFYDYKNSTIVVPMK